MCNINYCFFTTSALNGVEHQKIVDFEKKMNRKIRFSEVIKEKFQHYSQNRLKGAQTSVVNINYIDRLIQSLLEKSLAKNPCRYSDDETKHIPTEKLQKESILGQFRFGTHLQTFQ